MQLNNENAFQSTADHPYKMCVFCYARISRFCSCDLDLDLDLDPMTLIYEDNLDILKMYPHARNEFSKVRARTGQTEHAGQQTVQEQKRENQRDTERESFLVGTTK